MKKRKRIRSVSFLSAAVLICLAVTLVSFVKAECLKREKTAEIQQAICEFDEYVSAIDSSLSKGIYASTPPMILAVSTELWRLSSEAKTALSEVPNDSIDMSATNRFLSQLGELMMSLNRKSANGEKLGKKDVEQLKELSSYAKLLHKSADELRTGAFDGSIELIKPTGNITNSIKNDTVSLSYSLEQTEKALTDFPSLIYDGPFSDHLEDKTAAFLNGKKELSEKQAAKKAAEYLNIEEDSAVFTSTDSGVIEAYVFSADKRTVAVTKKGGYLSYMISSEYAGESRLSYSEARDKALSFLDKIGYEDMVDTYYSESDGICTINFAYERNSVRCYPDLVKVSVSMDDGKILSLDARNYLLSHRDRNIGKENFDNVSVAQSRVSSLLHIKNTRFCVIPTDSGDEKPCYEFHCADDEGQEVLVYIDSKTFNEDNILLLLYSDNGILTK